MKDQILNMVKPEPAAPESAKIEVIDIANFGSPIE